MKTVRSPVATASVRVLSLLLGLGLLCACPASTAVAQNYRFSVPRMRMENFILPDAAVRIVYTIEFENSVSGHAIDIVDIGLPHDDYHIDWMEASVDGHPVYGIRKSEYIDIGVEVRLHGRAIAPGQRGTFVFEATMPDMVYSDTTDERLASFQITPTWFDGSLLTGNTTLEIGVYLPQGVLAEQVLHQGEAFTAKADTDDGGAVVGWRYENTRLDRAHEVGLSFPRAVMTRVVELSAFDLLEMWWAGNTSVRVVAGLLILIGFGLIFFRFTARTGCSVFVPATALLIFLFVKFPNFQLYSIPVMIGLFVFMEWRLRRKRRKYLPPIASVEGGGIKRGLTAPEAAVLLELPLNRVLTLVIFGMLKKGLLRQVQDDPLEVEVDDAFAPEEHADRRRAAADAGVVVHEYEQLFLDLFVDKRGRPVEEIDFSDALRELIERVADRVRAFDVAETRRYYRSIVKRAWTGAKAIGEVESRTQVVDKNLEWMLIDDQYDDWFDAWGAGGYHYRPIWMRHHHPLGLYSEGGTSAGSGLSSAVSKTSGGGRTPSFGDVAASFAGWTENVAGRAASGLTGVAVSGGSEGVISLSGVDKVSGDILGALFSGSGGGGGGGGGGGCACACAGCACACACAGGGR